MRKLYGITAMLIGIIPLALAVVGNTNLTGFGTVFSAILLVFGTIFISSN